MSCDQTETTRENGREDLVDTFIWLVHEKGPTQTEKLLIHFI